MFKASALLFLVVVLLTLNGCSGSNDPSSQKDIYSFTMYDSLNAVIAKGKMTVDDRESEKLSGSYSFINVISEFSGYGSMKGKFTGKINKAEKMILIDTNPGAADNNVYFNVKIWPDRLEGDWYYTGLRQHMTYNKIVLKKD